MIPSPGSSICLHRPPDPAQGPTYAMSHFNGGDLSTPKAAGASAISSSSSAET
jgi:hypothetical protein